jgi:long-chain fatty acid transport protein
MKRRQFKAVAFLLGGALLAFSTSALATNGYFTHGVGAKSKGMAGTGIGSNANMGPIMVASNPALGVFAPDQWELGLGIFSPRRSYSVTASNFNGQFGAFSLGAGSYDSSSNYFPIPYLAKNWKLDDERALTLVFFGRGGMNTNWDDPNQTASFDPDGPGPGGAMAFPGTFGAGNAGVDLMQAFLALNYAGMASDNFSWGIAPVIAMQSFEATGVGSWIRVVLSVDDVDGRTRQVLGPVRGSGRIRYSGERQAGILLEDQRRDSPQFRHRIHAL